jgi:Cupredoxin-like domain
MPVDTPRFPKAGTINVKKQIKASRCAALLFGAILIYAAGSSASAEEIYKISIKDHKFTPAELTVPANERFLIEVENLDPTPAEFESFDLKVEKFVVGGGKITLRMRALKAGTYKFFDDYNPDLAQGKLIAVEGKPKP